VVVLWEEVPLGACQDPAGDVFGVQWELGWAGKVLGCPGASGAERGAAWLGRCHPPGTPRRGRGGVEVADTEPGLRVGGLSHREPKGGGAGVPMLSYAGPCQGSRSPSAGRLSALDRGRNSPSHCVRPPCSRGDGGGGPRGWGAASHVPAPIPPSPLLGPSPVPSCRSARGAAGSARSSVSARGPGATPQRRFWGLQETLWGARRLEDPPGEPMPRDAGLWKLMERRLR